MARHFYYLPIFLGFLALALTIPLVVIKLAMPAPTPPVTTRATQTVTTASIYPQTATYQVGKEISLGIIYESAEQKITSLDVVVIFDPTAVQVTAVTPGILLDSYKTTKYDNKLGQVIILGENAKAQAVNGILASFKFKPLRAGVVTFSFAHQTKAQKTAAGQFVITK